MGHFPSIWYLFNPNRSSPFRICGMIRARPGEVIELQAVGWIHNCSAQGREEGEAVSPH